MNARKVCHSTALVLLLFLGIILPAGFAQAQTQTQNRTQPTAVAEPATLQQAMETLRAYAGSLAVSQILSVTGEEGRTQPQVWEFALVDPRARSGRRIIRIAGGQVYYDQPATALLSTAQPRPVLNLARFAIDSKTAFNIANQEAVKARASYNHANYELYPGLPENTPNWKLSLVNDRAQIVGEVTINASSGLVIGSRWDPDITGPNAGNVKDDAQALERAGRTIDRTVDRVGDSIRRLFNR